LSERLTLLWGIALKLGAPILILVLLIVFVVEIWGHRVYRIEPADDSTDAHADGLNGSRLTDAFLYSLTDVERQSRAAMLTLIHVDAYDKPFDFKIPHTSVSFQALVSAVRDSLGRGDITLTTNLWKDGPVFVMVTVVHNPRRPNPYTVIRTSDPSAQKALQTNALRVVALFDPLSAGAYELSLAYSSCQHRGCTAYDFRDARVDLSAALRDAAHNPSDRETQYRAFMALSSLAAFMGDHETAIGYAQCALALKPGEAGATEALGVEYDAIGRSSDAKIEFDRAKATLTQSSPSGVVLSYVFEDRANDEMRANQLDPAIQDYTSALRNRLGDPGVKAKLGYALFRAKRYREAVDCLTDAINSVPSSAEYHDDLANAVRGYATESSSAPAASQTHLVCLPYSATHDLRRAIDEHTVALTLARQQGDRRWESFSELDRGKTWEAMGDQVKAVNDYRAALSADPSDIYAYETLVQLYGRQGKRELAMTVALQEVTNTDSEDTACKDFANSKAQYGAHSLPAYSENAVRLVCGEKQHPSTAAGRNPGHFEDLCRRE
jgi:tetratricopeptide (TPR) repeat protein